MIFKSYEVGRRVEGFDPYGQPQNSFEVIKTAKMFISIKSQQNTNDPRFVNTTHTALTLDKDFKIDYLIKDGEKNYKVMLINAEHRLTTLHLQEV